MWRSFVSGRALVPLVAAALAVSVIVFVVFVGSASRPGGSQTSAGRNGLIAFTDETQSAGSASFDIFTMRADGSERHQVTHDGLAGSPAWSSDSRQILYTHDTGYEPDFGTVSDIWVMDADGSHERPLVEGATNDFDPAWAPDGNRFVFTRGELESQLFVYSFDTGRVRALTDPETWQTAGAGSWSPDGELIAFSGARVEAPGNEDLFTVRVDGTGLRQLTATRRQSEGNPDWAPDGRRLVYEVLDFRPYNELDQDRPQLRVVDRSGTHVRQLQRYTEGVGVTWSPDGRWIAATGIRVIRSDGSSVRELSRGGEPDWGAEPGR